MLENSRGRGANRHVRVIWILAFLLSGLAAVQVPWQQVHPSNPSLQVSLGYAPFWTTRFSSIPGACIDIPSVAVNLLVIWIVFVAVKVILAASAPVDRP